MAYFPVIPQKSTSNFHQSSNISFTGNRTRYSGVASSELCQEKSVITQQNVTVSKHRPDFNTFIVNRSR